MAKFYLITFGCKLNQADSALIRRVVAKFHKEASEKEADFVILNTCGVVEKTELKIIKKAKELKRKRKKIILAGCLPLISPEVAENIADGMVGPTNILDLPKVIKGVLGGKKTISLKTRFLDKARLGCVALNKESCVAIIPISEGCLSSCAYCVTRLARKKLKSFKKEAILENIKSAISMGAKEIQLTSQDLAIYGLDKGKMELGDLLKEIAKIQGSFKVRLGMMNPQYAKRIFNQILKILKDDKFYKFLHLPFQSGSNNILKAMGRGYKREDILRLVKGFRRKFKRGLLATDVIVGFPGESERDFKETLSLVKKIKPDILHIFKFSKRKGSLCDHLKDFPDRIKKERSKILTRVWKEIAKEQSRKYLGKTLKVLIVEKRGNSFLARPDSYKAVILKEGKVGEWQRVKIIKTKPNYLVGKTLKN